MLFVVVPLPMNFQEAGLHCQEVCKGDDGFIFIVRYSCPRQSQCIVHFYEAFFFMPPQSRSLDAMGRTRNKWGCGFLRVVGKAHKIIAGCVNFLPGVTWLFLGKTRTLLWTNSRNPSYYFFLQMNGELYTAIGFPPAEQSVCRPADDGHAKSMRSDGNHEVGRMICTEVEKMACMWFGEICYCCS